MGEGGSHSNLYHIFRMDQADNPMPEQRVRELRELLRSLYPPDTGQ